MTRATALPRSHDLENLLAAAQLPALPQSAIKILELAQHPKNGPAEFAVPVEADPGLTGQILRFVNSSYFGFSREISSVKLAITLVGIRTIKNFSLWTAVFSLMPNPKCGPFDLKSLWQDSLRRGLFARALARMLGAREAEGTFAAALLQDMAIPLLAKELPAQYAELIEARAGSGLRLSALEQERFGWNHAQAGALMARRWKLPEDFENMVATHIEADVLARCGKSQPGMVAVNLSSLLPASMDEQWHDFARFDELYQAIRPATAPTALDVLARVDHEFAEFAPLLKVGTPGQSLADRYRAAHERDLSGCEKHCGSPQS